MSTLDKISFQQKNILSIQYLRGIAAIAVVIFHLGEPAGLKLSLGRAGVDLFFVISGFIMWLVTQGRENQPLVFLKKRIFRIVPLYWGVTLFLALAARAKPNWFPLDHPVVGHVVKSLFFIPHVSPAGNNYPMVAQGWTLNYEMFFYALYAMVLCAPSRMRLACLAGAITLLVAFGLIATPQGPIGATYSSPLLLEFLAGVLIGRLWLAPLPVAPRYGWLCLAAGCAGFTAACFFPDMPRVVIFGIPAALIVLGATILERTIAIVKLPLLKLLGDASYSIYLVHDLVMVAVMLVAAHIYIAYNLPVYLLTVLVALVAGSLAYFVVEKPLAAFLTRKTKLQIKPQRAA